MYNSSSLVAVEKKEGGDRNSKLTAEKLIVVDL